MMKRQSIETAVVVGLFVSLAGCSDPADADKSGDADESDSDSSSSSTTKGNGNTSAGSDGNSNTSANDSSASTTGGSGGGMADDGSSSGGGSGGAASSDTGGDSTTGGVEVENPLTDPEEGPPAGTPDASCSVPSEAGLEDSSNPDQVVGDGTPESCTGDAFIDAVAQGGVISFDCGAEPHTITLDRPAKVVNDASDTIVIDGGGKVTLSGAGATRILYMNTCDEAQHWTTDHCDNQDHPRLTVQNLTFIDANSKNETEYDGGGAIWVRGGRFKVINSRFFNNVCAEEGPDVGGGAIRVFSQFDQEPVYVVNSTFGGAEALGNSGANGGGISSIGVNWTIINSVFTHNRALGDGGNPAEAGTVGGGSGGAIYNDGNTLTLSLCGSIIENNSVNAYGSAIFFVSNNHDGTLRVDDSTIRDNTGGGWNVLPGISMHEDTVQLIENSTIED